MIFCSPKKKNICRLSKLISKDHESDTQVWFIIYNLITILVRFHSGLELVDCLSLIYSLTKMPDVPENSFYVWWAAVLHSWCKGIGRSTIPFIAIGYKVAIKDKYCYFNPTMLCCLKRGPDPFSPIRLRTRPHLTWP